MFTGAQLGVLCFVRPLCPWIRRGVRVPWFFFLCHISPGIPTIDSISSSLSCSVLLPVLAGVLGPRLRSGCLALSDCPLSTACPFWYKQLYLSHALLSRARPTTPARLCHREIDGESAVFSTTTESPWQQWPRHCSPASIWTEGDEIDSRREYNHSDEKLLRNISLLLFVPRRREHLPRLFQLTLTSADLGSWHLTLSVLYEPLTRMLIQEVLSTRDASSAYNPISFFVL